MFNFSDTSSFFVICSGLLLSFSLFSEAGPNNLHIYDSTTTAEIIGGDVFFEITDPLELEYTYRIHPAKDFGAPFNESFRIKNAHLVPVVPMYCCDTPDNMDDLVGNVALIERGECSFKKKTIIAERAGARAVIITDVSQLNDDFVIEMVDDNSTDETLIPAGFLMGQNGLIIRRTLDKLNRRYALINLPINLTFTPIQEINLPPWMEW